MRSGGTARRVGGAVGAVLGLALLVPAGAAAVNLRPGDLVVSEAGGAGGSGQIDKVNPRTGAVTPISNNTISNSAGGEQDFDFPFGLAFARNGDIFVADRDAFGTGGVIRVNPETGAQTAVSNNAISAGAGGAAVFSDAASLLRRKHGKLLVSNFGASPNVARVNVQSGKAVVVSDDNKLTAPWGLLGDGKRVLVADSEAFGGDGGVIRVNPSTGGQQTVSAEDKFREPYSVVHAPRGKLFVSDADAFGGNGGVIRVNPATGKQAELASGGNFLDPGGMAMRPSGKLVIADFGLGGVIRLDPATGDQRVLVPSGLENPLAVAVVPR